MDFLNKIDPFVRQLFLVPVFVIGLGVYVSYVTKRIWVAPVLTLLLNTLYNTWYALSNYPVSYVNWSMITAWCVTFPVISFLISYILVKGFYKKV
ncbi:hypothetical protein ACQKN7_09670 [Bacillus cereus]|uniref:hypothetical protein n=2 Tax=Bacillus cereus TaxID=1396 RepID=UPI003CFF7D4A